MTAMKFDSIEQLQAAAQELQMEQITAAFDPDVDKEALQAKIDAFDEASTEFLREETTRQQAQAEADAKAGGYFLDVPVTVNGWLGEITQDAGVIRHFAQELVSERDPLVAGLANTMLALVDALVEARS